MNNLAIKIENVSKLYGDRIVLDNINITVNKCECIGIIGRNGAGKSTLLKILSGMLKPTYGNIQINGKVTSILEIGSGFHSDLTGRENIVMVLNLYGNIDDLDLKIEEIIEFSELNDAIDFPIRTYSNGMYLKLAFSLFTHLDTDILLLDEVISVGDSAFRLKSLNQIQYLKNKGITLVLISHNFNDIMNYCDRVIQIDVNIIQDSNQVRDVISNYCIENNFINNQIDSEWIRMKNHPNPIESIRSQEFELREIYCESNKQVKTTFLTNESFNINILYLKKSNYKSLQFTIKIFDFNETLLLFDTIGFFDEELNQDQPEGNYFLSMNVPAYFFNSGIFFITLIVSEQNKLIGVWHQITLFEIKKDITIDSKVWVNTPSPLLPKFNWILEYKSFGKE